MSLVSKPCRSTNQNCRMASCLREPLTHHGVADLIGDANPRGASAQNDDALVAERRSADADRGDRRRQRDRPGALHIVVERAVWYAIPSRECGVQLPGAKFSQCSSAFGNSLVTVFT